MTSPQDKANADAAISVLVQRLTTLDNPPRETAVEYLACIQKAYPGIEGFTTPGRTGISIEQAMVTAKDAMVAVRGKQNWPRHEASWLYLMIDGQLKPLKSPVAKPSWQETAERRGLPLAETQHIRPR